MNMSDQWWALLAGAGTVIALRMLDFFMPKGWVSSWTKRHAERIKDDNGDSGDGSALLAAYHHQHQEDT